MKIGKLVKQHITPIFRHCNDVEHDELNRLLDPTYAKKVFRIGYPFCIELDKIEESESARYYPVSYPVRGRTVRVTSQWYEKNRQPFIKYLESKGIAIDSSEYEQGEDQAQKQQAPSSRHNSRYRGNHIGNAQNLFIRNVLSNLGLESFNEAHWNSTKDYFSHKCAYCGTEAELEMDHAIPINKDKLGEHRLGNVVPICKPCNTDKGGKTFIEFLAENTSAVRRIEEFMKSRDYVPLEDNGQIKKILEMAHKDVAALADKYVSIINILLSQR